MGHQGQTEQGKQVGEQKQHHQTGTHHCRGQSRLVKDHGHSNAANGCQAIEPATENAGAPFQGFARLTLWAQALKLSQCNRENECSNQQAQGVGRQALLGQYTQWNENQIAQRQDPQPRPVHIGPTGFEQADAGQNLEHEQGRYDLSRWQKNRQTGDTKRRKSKPHQAPDKPGKQHHQAAAQQGQCMGTVGNGEGG